MAPREDLNFCLAQPSALQCLYPGSADASGGGGNVYSTSPGMDLVRPGTAADCSSVNMPGLAVQVWPNLLSRARPRAATTTTSAWWTPLIFRYRSNSMTRSRHTASMPHARSICDHPARPDNRSWTNRGMWSPATASAASMELRTTAVRVPMLLRKPAITCIGIRTTEDRFSSSPVLPSTATRSTTHRAISA